ncbi:Repeat domain-containing protein [Desulfatibacillum alkenivorans DSM 16219]|uniref:Repeat domain-containing protein n=1 Tax=Desulfatibacillum alkenivorans DSM 16219 TaxID=1121393 RepID=A0A1M6I7M5_9BACT|nr:VCBS repeat-containing protein [Desulfatibacillum alkenivorans]SHJ30395.1 Repeat domain-containing protein [Desulfatibacillum alkenivorans DSM 16219]
MKQGRRIQAIDSKNVAKALEEVGSTALFASRKFGCALAFTNTGSGLESKVHQFTTAQPITRKGGLSRSACKELAAAGVFTPSGSGSSAKRLIARGAIAAAFSGALVLGGGVGDALADGLGLNYYGGTNPLAGAMEEYSKPAFVDIDKDGDLDCFVGNRQGSINFWENQGGKTQPNFVFVKPKSNPLYGTEEFFRYTAPSFVDIDGDCDMDCFVGTWEGGYHQTWQNKSSDYMSSISFFENKGTPQAPVFDISNIVVSGTTKAMNYNPLVVGDLWDAVPTFVDIDGDGDMDCMVGGYYGYVAFFENITGEVERQKGPVTATIEFACQGYLQDSESNTIYAGYNAAPAFSDVDGDGDMDLLLGSAYGPLVFFENTGDKYGYSFEERTQDENPFRVDPGVASAPVFADINGDGLDDLFTGTNGYNSFYSEYIMANPMVPYFGSTDSLEAMLSNNSIRYYQNTGTKTEPDYRSRGDNPFNLGPVAATSIPALGDVDGDGDMDAVVGGLSYNFYDGGQKAQSKASSGRSLLNYYENIGGEADPLFALHSLDDEPISWPGNYFLPSPGIADMNGDGINEVYAGYSQYSVVIEPTGVYKRKSMLIGGGNIDAFEYEPETRKFKALDQNPLGELGILPIYPSPAFVDIDGDGDLDVFVSGMVGENQGGVYFYRNDGTTVTPTLHLITDTVFFDPMASMIQYTISPISGSELITQTEVISGVVGSFVPTLSFADFDGDGDQDAVMGDRLPWYRKLMYFAGDEGPRKGEELPDAHDVIWQDARYFKNVGTRTSPAFEEQAGSANPFAIASKKTFPGAVVMADLDNDNDMDAVAGDSTGKLTYLRNVRTVDEAAAIFKSDDDLCFVQTAGSESSSVWRKVREFFAPSRY